MRTWKYEDPRQMVAAVKPQFDARVNRWLEAESGMNSMPPDGPY